MRVRLAKIAIYLGMTAVLLLILEGVGQLSITFLESNRVTGVFGEELLNHREPLLGFGLKKNIDKQLGHWRVTTNNLGFRDFPFPAKKPDDELRVFILGGSTVFGWGALEKDTIPSMIESRTLEFAKTHKISKKIRVINAGVPWYSSWHEAAQVLFRIMPLDPDWIIALDGLNDVAQGILPNWYPIYLGYQDLPTTIAMQKRYAKKNFFLEVLKLSPTFRYFHAKMTARAQIQTGVFRTEIWDQYEQYMTWLHGLTESQGVRFAVFLQPTIAVDYEPSERERRSNASTLRYPKFASIFRDVYRVGVRRFENTNKFRFKSLHALFKGLDEFLYFDGLHYTGTANNHIAEAIYQHEVLPELKRRFLKPTEVAQK